MKVVKATGLVPVINHQTGEIIGISPEAARGGVPKGQYTLVSDEEIEKAGVEVFDVDDGFNVPPKPVDSTGQVEGVQIPSNWEGLHHLQRIALAKQIDPDHKAEGEEKKTDAADRVIRAEISRRSGDVVIAGGGEQNTANFTPAPDQTIDNVAGEGVAGATNVGPVGGEAGTSNVTPADPASPPTEVPALTTAAAEGTAPAATTPVVTAPAADATKATDTAAETKPAAKPAAAKGDLPLEEDKPKEAPKPAAKPATAKPSDDVKI